MGLIGFVALFRATLHPVLCAKPYALQNLPFLSYSPTHLWGLHLLRLCPELPSSPAHPHTRAPSPWTISRLTIQTSVSLFFTPSSSPKSVRFLLFDHLIMLVYWLYKCGYLILNCRFQGPLASSPVLSPLCPVGHSQSSIFLSHWPSFSYSAFPPTSADLYTFLSLKEQMYALQSLIT